MDPDALRTVAMTLMKVAEESELEHCPLKLNLMTSP